ncbi:hypothetical protein EAI_04658 [Harpegnathos saltator]|uniref:Uncharacterized protein n=1 Tax=Harpegnathos saltator TaxID=610380 RepID=E2BCV6_HARSA|nr:hypothetical protein EAI_04658 [Harpegnathos saltator]
MTSVLSTGLRAHGIGAKHRAVLHKAKALKERRKRLLCETTVVRGGTVAQRHFSSLRQINKDVLEALLRGTSVLGENSMSTLRRELPSRPRSVRTRELVSEEGYLVGVMGLYERDLG